jgi:CubicO group peptidase (beta-lactamase class C family)
MRRLAALVGAVALALALAAVGIAPARAGTPFAAADAAMRARVADDGLAGGVLLVAQGDDVVHRFATGRMTEDTVIPIASASKWLTAAMLMTFVDEGRVDLDDPVSRFLPAFDGAKAAITVRELLSHRTGLPSAPCEGDPGTTLARCVRTIARGGDPASPPGTEFHYSGVGFVIAGRLIEHLSGTSFEATFESRIARPLGMTRTRFDGTGRSHNRNRAPAASARSTVRDYARFLRMLAHDGAVDGQVVLQAASVAEIERDQVVGLDTTDDGAVQITGIPTYGLGVWRDVVSADDSIEVVSGSGALGFYPWIDRMHDAYGIVAVDDERNGAEHAVPASQRIARMLWEAAAS